MKQKSKPPLDEKRIIKENPMICEEALAGYAEATRIMRTLEKAGIVPKSGYNIEPPLGRRSGQRPDR